jgi:aromatic-L-amino-acid decarboxylase
LVDWLAARLASADEDPIIPALKPGDIMSRLPEAAPEDPEDFLELLNDLDSVVRPGLVGWQHPGWFAFFPGNTSPPSILAELAAAGLAQQGMLWSTSPATTEIEMRVLDWLVDLLGLPSTWKSSGTGGGVIQMSASDATHVAAVVARARAGSRAPLDSLVAYGSAQAHSSIEKGARVAGFRHYRAVDVGDGYAIAVEALEEAIRRDLAAGLVPAWLVSTVGTTGTTAIDPVRACAKVARKHGIWHHVDAAFAGSAMICPEFRHLQDGLESVDSYVFNPHKWLLTNFDCSAFYVADRQALIDTLSIVPPYLRGAMAESTAVFDYRDWHVALGRRFRALKLWWVLRAYGAKGLRAFIREHVRLAQMLATRIETHPRLDLFAPVPLSLVCFRHVDGNLATTELARAINESGHSYVTPSVIGDETFIRVSIGQTGTAQTHVERLWNLIAARA